MTLLNLEPFGQKNIDISNIILYAANLCIDNAEHDLTCAQLVENLLKAGSSSKFSGTEQAIYINLAVESVHLLMELEEKDKKKAYFITDKKALISTYITGCKTDADNNLKLSQVFLNILNLEKIELDFIATLLFCLENKLDEFKEYSRPKSDINLLNKLIEIISPLILPCEHLAKIYMICKSNLAIKYSKIQMIDNIPCKRKIYYLFKESWFLTFSKGMQKTYNKLKEIQETEKDQLYPQKLFHTITMPYELAQGIAYSFDLLYLNIEQTGEIIDEFKDIVTLNPAQTIHKKKYSAPSLYDLNLDNYFLFGFSVFYQSVIFYKKLSVILSKAKENLSKQYVSKTLIEELSQIHQEAENTILSIKNLTKEQKKIAKTSLNLPNIPKDFQKQTNWTEILSKINKTTLEHLATLFNFNGKEFSLKFKQVINIILALGGQVATFDGSKTRILLPGTTNTLEIMGGLHRPHDEKLKWIHVKLITKALNKAGLTKELLESVLKEKNDFKNKLRAF